MTLDIGNTDKLAEFRAEAERLGIKVVPPSVNRSDVAFEVDGNAIHYALAALKGVGRQAVEAIVERARRAAVHRPRRLRQPHQSARRQQARARKPRGVGRLRRAREQSRARLRGGRRHPGGVAARASRPRRAARSSSRSARPRRAARCRCPSASPGCRPSGCRRSSTPSASSSPAIRSTTTCRRSSACACRPGPSSPAR